MRSCLLCALLALTTLLGACAHNIVITPETKALPVSQAVIDRKVGYYIASADYDAQVTTPGGGGDKVTYKPYRELEPALERVLFNTFSQVQRVSSLDAEVLKRDGVTLVFEPKYKTDSSSGNVLTWMPNHFVVELTCSAYDQQGQKIWSGQYKGIGDSDFSETKHDFSAAAEKASLDAFRQLETALQAEPLFRATAAR
jgi:hypothetical protein